MQWPRRCATRAAVTRLACRVKDYYTVLQTCTNAFQDTNICSSSVSASPLLCLGLMVLWKQTHCRTHGDDRGAIPGQRRGCISR